MDLNKKKKTFDTNGSLESHMIFAHKKINIF